MEELDVPINTDGLVIFLAGGPSSILPAVEEVVGSEVIKGMSTVISSSGVMAEILRLPAEVAEVVSVQLSLGCFKHARLDLQLVPQLSPNSTSTQSINILINPNLNRVGVRVGVQCLNAIYFHPF